jgi:hypothetical protein
MYAVRAVEDARPYAFFHVRHAGGRNVRGAIAIAPYDVYVMYIVRAVGNARPYERRTRHTSKNAPSAKALSAPITAHINYYTQK